MGADGGSINKSSNLKLHVERTSNDYKARDDNLLEFSLESRWECCKISNLPLRLPIVSDYLGNLYNKESVLEWLLCKDKDTKYDPKLRNEIKHIRKIHDIIELNNLVEVKSKDKNNRTVKIKCKYGDEIFGDKLKTSFVYCVKCGDVVPKESLHLNLSGTNECKCPVCNEIVAPSNDIIVLNPTSQLDIQNLTDRYNKLCHGNLYHDGTKSKKRKKSSSITTTKKQKTSKV
ncbi:hypothetical protein MOUN0_L00298 [Monosporozyma unispora]|nr:hypothetical protein C6P44_003022 [Kazachstania unispora]